MSSERKPFASYRPAGRELPLPSVMDEQKRQLVSSLLDLWRGIYRDNIHKDRERMAKIVNEHYDSLGKEDVEWLERADPNHPDKTRGIMIKERAIQLAQIDQTPVSKRQRKLV